MNDNLEKELKKDINIIEYSKNKYLFIGFIIGIIPFIIVLSLIVNIDSYYEYNLIDFIILIGIIISIANAIFMKEIAHNKLIQIFKQKYHLDYEKIKKMY